MTWSVFALSKSWPCFFECTREQFVTPKVRMIRFIISPPALRSRTTFIIVSICSRHALCVQMDGIKVVIKRAADIKKETNF